MKEGIKVTFIFQGCRRKGIVSHLAKKRTKRKGVRWWWVVLTDCLKNEIQPEGKLVMLEEKGLQPFTKGDHDDDSNDS